MQFARLSVVMLIGDYARGMMPFLHGCRTWIWSGGEKAQPIALAKVWAALRHGPG